MFRSVSASLPATAVVTASEWSRSTLQRNASSLPDNPSTPEDEYSAHSYGLKPYVYVQDYKTGDGAEASYYVQTYTVEQ